MWNNLCKLEIFTIFSGRKIYIEFVWSTWSGSWQIWQGLSKKHWCRIRQQIPLDRNSSIWAWVGDNTGMVSIVTFLTLCERRKKFMWMNEKKYQREIPVALSLLQYFLRVRKRSLSTGNSREFYFNIYINQLHKLHFHSFTFYQQKKSFADLLNENWVNKS